MALTVTESNGTARVRPPLRPESPRKQRQCQTMDYGVLPRPSISAARCSRSVHTRTRYRPPDARARRREQRPYRGVSHHGRPRRTLGRAAPEARPGWRGIERPPAPPTGAGTRDLRLSTNHHSPTDHLTSDHGTTPVAHSLLLPGAMASTSPVHRRARARPGAQGAQGRLAQLRRSFLGRLVLGHRAAAAIFASRAHVLAPWRLPAMLLVVPLGD